MAVQQYSMITSSVIKSNAAHWPSKFQAKGERKILSHVVQSQLPADLLQLTIEPVHNYGGSTKHFMQSADLEYTYDRIDRKQKKS